MNLAGLSLEQAPPISVPLRFFLSAPPFAMIAAIVLLSAGPDALLSRWSPALLATTHLLTLGFMAMVMMGAMLQMLPVVAGATVPHPHLTTGLVHPALAGGALLLPAGLYFGQASLIVIAILALVFGFLIFLFAMAVSLIRVSARNATINAMRLAVASLAITVGVGVTLALAVAGYVAVSPLLLADVHVAWGLLGWVGVLIIGVSYQVVPMFQLTPVYPRGLSRWLAGVVFILIGLRSGSMLLPEGKAAWLASVLSGGLSVCFSLFSVATLYVQRKRRRHVPDVTLQFWRLGMVSLLGGILLWLTGQFDPALQQSASYPVLLGVLFILGFAMSVINGMLYKIVPFLVWFHLYSRRSPGKAIPTMKEILPDRVAWRQMYVYLASLVLLLVSVVWPGTFIIFLASCTWLVSSGLLWSNLLAAARLYRQCVFDAA